MNRVRSKKSVCPQRAQLSLEYLLLLAAFFSVLLLVLPLIARTFELALFGFDSRQAVSFSKEFAETVAQLSILSDGSVLPVEATPMHDWIVSVSGGKLSVSLSSPELGKTKTIETGLVSVFSFKKSFGEKEVFLLKKKNGALTVDSYP